MKKRGEEILNKLKKEKRVYSVQKELSEKLSIDLQNVSIRAHKEFINQQNIADKALKDIKLI